MYNYASLWVAMSVCIPTYMLASGLIAGGMNWWQAVGTILLGNLIVLVPMLLNAHAGTKYGIPFPVLVRASFGVRGANLPGRSARAGGMRLVRHPDLDRRPGDPSMLQILWPAASASPAVGLDLLRRFLAAQHVRDLEGHRDHPVSGRNRRAVHARRRAPAACGGSPARPAGFGPVLQHSQQVPRQRASSSTFSFRRLTGMVGFWATVALNIPDFTRYATSQRAQALGQALGLADGDDAVFVHRRGGHVGFGGAVRGSRSGTRLL